MEQKINEIMHVMNSIEYGFRDENNKNIIYDEEKWRNEFNDFYYLQTPKELLKSKCGICWDQVELERELFKNTKFKYETYFIYLNDNNMLPSHTFLVYQNNNNYYWFEHSWNKYMGVHQYKSMKKLYEDVKNKFVKEFFPKVKETDFNDKVDPVEFFKLTEDMNQNTMKKEKKLEKIFSPKKPVITYILIVLNLMVFLYGVLHGNDELINMFGNNYELVQNGEFYRLFTCMFVHADILHILFNMIALYSIGPVVERYYGKSKFLLIYLVSGLLGSIFSGVFMTADSISIGASGAIFGLLGSICYFTYYYRATLQGILRGSIMPVIIINLVIGFLSSSIDLSAHIGGLIGGILISMAIGIGDKHRKSDQINGLVVLILMAAFLIYMMMTK